jgi:hypothetical protein
MASGEVPIPHRVSAAAVNHSIFGIVLKLQLLGVPGMSMHVASLVAWVYTAAIVAPIVWLTPVCGSPRAGVALARDHSTRRFIARSRRMSTLVAPVWMLALLAIAVAGSAVACVSRRGSQRP